LLAAAPEADIWFCEGEKDADNLAALGLVATTYSEGARAPWPAEITKWFGGKKTAYILEDNDEDGRRHAGKNANALKGTVSDNRIGLFPRARGAGRLSGWVEKGIQEGEFPAPPKGGACAARRLQNDPPPPHPAAQCALAWGRTPSRRFPRNTHRTARY